MGGRGARYTSARNLVGQYEISDITDSKNKIVDFYRYVMEHGDINVERNADGSVKQVHIKRAVMDRAEQLASELANRIEIRDVEAEADYRDIRSMLSGQYYLSKQDRSDIADFSAYARSRENLLRLTSNPNALSINQAYHELSEQYPAYFGQSGVTHPADQLQEINRVLGSLRNSSIPLSPSDRRGVAEELTWDLLRSYTTMQRQRRRA